MILRPFQQYFISGRWEVDNERLCAMKLRFLCSELGSNEKYYIYLTIRQDISSFQYYPSYVNQLCVILRVLI